MRNVGQGCKAWNRDRIVSRGQLRRQGEEGEVWNGQKNAGQNCKTLKMEESMLNDTYPTRHDASFSTGRRGFSWTMQISYSFSLLDALG